MAEAAQVDHRIAPRTNMFVLANLAARDCSGPVKVRNLSTTGAMVEGGVLPAPGESVSLLRGSLRSDARVVWRRNGRAGIRFEAQVTVSDWLPQGAAQSRLRQNEALVSQLKAEAAAKPVTPTYREVAPSGIARAEVTRLAADLEQFSEMLADDDTVVLRHGDKMQVLDAVVQALHKLALLASEEPST